MRLGVALDPGVVEAVSPWSVVAAIVIIVLAWILSRIARKTVVSLSDRIEGIQPDHARLAGRVTQYFVLFLGIGVALTFLGANLQPLIASVILIAVVLSLALRGIAENFASGIILQTRRPITIGDEIDSLGYNGVVTDINGRSVVIDTFDGRRVHLPNSEVLSNPLVNDSSRRARRSEIEVRATDVAVDDLIVRLQRIVADVDGVLANPEPAVYVTAVDPSRVTVLVRFWHAPSQSKPVVSEVIRRIGSGDTIAAISPVPHTPLTPPAAL